MKISPGNLLEISPPISSQLPLWLPNRLCGKKTVLCVHVEGCLVRVLYHGTVFLVMKDFVKSCVT